ncbi:MAG: folate family ECF transporter S component [Acutalibacteraceae bacterium]
MQTNINSIYLSKCSKEYWKVSASQLKNLKTMPAMALLLAFNIVIGTFFIPVGISLRVYFTFIPTAVAGFIGGPFLAIIYGFSSDILGFIAHPSGAFFPGRTLSSMLGALIFSLFLFRSRVTVLKIALSKLCVNLFVNIMLNSLWNFILYDKGYYYFLTKSIVKNFAMLPFEIIILVSIFKMLIPILCKLKIIPSDTQKQISII